MSRADLFPDAHKTGQDARVAAAWCLDYPLPVPARHRPLRCPVCGVGDMVLKDWKFHKRDKTGSKAPWRCDVRLKCVSCSHVPIFGIPVPEAMYAAHATKVRTPWISWREGKAILAQAGYFD